MMQPLEFIYQSQPSRVIFGAGSLRHLEREMSAMGVRRALVLSTPQQSASAKAIAERLGELAVGLVDGAAMHVPAETIDIAAETARQVDADCTVAFGGGSTIGLAKALARTAALPILAIPTTYAGSEMTSIYGITEKGVKITGKDPVVLPKSVIYDPELTLSLPVGMSIVSGINAIAHAAEGLYACDANPILSLMAEEGIRAMASALPKLNEDPANLVFRSEALYGAWLCGCVLGNAGMALHHKLCHVLGGSFGLPHAETHTVVLPYALAYNAPAARSAMERITRALKTADAPSGLQQLTRRCGGPTALREIGMIEADLDRAADLACENSYWNPRPLDRADLRQLLQAAFDGAPVSVAS